MNHGFQSDAELLRRLRLQFDAIEAAQTAEVLDARRLRELVAMEAALVAEGRWMSGPATLFGVLRLRWREVENCRVLGWLFDPLAPHGLGLDILHRLLDRLEGNGAGSFHREGLERATVTLEEAGNRTRADLILRGPSWTVLIEAKIHATEGANQGQRLESNWPDATYVFLTPHARTMRTAGEATWWPMTWTDIGGMVREALAETARRPVSPEARTARAAVADYLIATGQMEHPR